MLDLLESKVNSFDLNSFWSAERSSINEFLFHFLHAFFTGTDPKFFISSQLPTPLTTQNYKYISDFTVHVDKANVI